MTRGELSGAVIEAERAIRALSRSTSAERRVAERASIIVRRVYDALGTCETARTLGITRQTVTKWTRRFLANPGVKALDDAHRPGRPAEYGEHDHAVILTLACQRPEDVGRLEARLTQEIIAEEAAKQGVGVSRSTVQRILANAEVRPHKERYYLFTDKQDPNYMERRDAICALYTAELPDDEIVVCFDEMTGVQALGLPKGLPHGGRRAATRAHEPKVEFQYVRHGARTIAAIVRPDTGELVAGEVFPARGYDTECAIAMLETVLDSLPTFRRIHLVWDNHSTHRSHAMREFLASDRAARLHPVYTPTHASWLDLCENFFSRFSRRYLRGKRYDGLVALDHHVYACFEDYARVARPMRWTYNPAKAA